MGSVALNARAAALLISRERLRPADSPSIPSILLQLFCTESRTELSALFTCLLWIPVSFFQTRQECFKMKSIMYFSPPSAPLSSLSACFSYWCRTVSASAGVEEPFDFPSLSWLTFPPQTLDIWKSSFWISRVCARPSADAQTTASCCGPSLCRAAGCSGV